MNKKTSPQDIQTLDALKLFNEFQAQSRARSEATLKLVVGVSGAMLTLSVGAVLSGTPVKIPTDLLPCLQIGWALLFFSIAASLFLLCSMIVATFHMGTRWRKALESKPTGTEVISTWPWLRYVNISLALVILCSFLVGIGFVARVAIGVAGVPPTVAVQPVVAAMPSSIAAQASVTSITSASSAANR